MENQKLPNEKTAMILGLTSFVGCCCTSGLVGVILAYLGLQKCNQDIKLSQENPGVYNTSNIETWKTVNTISLILSGLVLLYTIYQYATGQAQEQQRQMLELLEKIANKQ